MDLNEAIRNIPELGKIEDEELRKHRYRKSHTHVYRTYAKMKRSISIHLLF